MTYEGDVESELRKNNINDVVILDKRLATIYVDDDFDESILNSISEISWWHESMPLSSLIDITDNMQSGETITIASGTDYTNKNPYTDLKGRKTIVAIIDSGIDYLHPDFIREDNTSRIISIWDQESTKASPPKGLLFGSEFLNEDINKAIRENDNTLSIDKIGTGTYAAGITSGGGRLNPLYQGVAPESELIVVKLREYEGVYKRGKINYTNSDFLAAIRYVLNVWSEQKNKVLIINLTVGAMSSATANTNILEIFDELTSAGVFVVSGAGNEGNTDIHYSGKFEDSYYMDDVIIQIGEQDNIDIVLNTVGPNKINAMLISPAGETGYVMAYSPDDFIYKGKFNLEDTAYSMQYIFPYISTGAQRLDIKLYDVKPGVWTLRLTPDDIISGAYDIYLPNKNLISDETRFLDPDSVSTLSMYAIGYNVITVGTYNDKTDSMWLGSSKGSDRSSIAKPDIVAPGVDIISTFINKSYNTATGTGVSSSIVAGVVSLLSEYLTGQSNDVRSSLYTQPMKTYLMLGASKKSIYIYPNISQGYGVLDLKNTIEEIANNL